MNRTFNALIRALLGGTIAFPASAQTYTTFDVPGSTSTAAVSITSTGEIAGTFQDAKNIYHGFLRATDGTITTFDPPVAGAMIEPNGMGLDPGGAVAGFWTNPAGFNRAFLRLANGTLFALPFPQAPGNYNARATGISYNGVVVGWLQTPSPFFVQGFVRSKAGAISLFSFPGSNATKPAAINGSGEITGFYYGADNLAHGFLDVQGTFTSFDPPGSINTVPVGISSAGLIGGYYGTASSGGHGFIRDSSGAITPFDAPKSFGTTGVTAINAAGAVVGWFDFASEHPTNIRSFVRFPSGVLVPFEVPGATLTIAEGINDSGAVVGYYSGTDGFAHAFLRQP